MSYIQVNHKVLSEELKNAKKSKEEFKEAQTKYQEA
jgi:hypothetical protein